MTVLLREPTAEMAPEIAAYRQEMLAAGSSMDGCGSLRHTGDPLQWLAQVESLRREETCPPQWVPATQFVALDQDGRLVGMIQVRRRFNDFLERYGGHIGYSVRPGQRRRGVAKEMLRQALVYCKEIGLTRVLITCLEENEASRRTILANGGVYESTVFEPQEQVRLQRYWITLGEES